MKYTTELTEQLITTEAGRRALDYISPIYGEAQVALRILNSIGKELQEQADWAEELWKQIHPQTATWSLSTWETEYGITPDETKTNTERRRAVVNKIQSKAQMNPAKLAQAVSVATGESSRIEENVSLNKFEVWILATGTDESKIKSIINRVKPAHLIYEIKYEKSEDMIAYFVAIMQTAQKITIEQVN